jgi:hypothetical protein
LSYYLGWTSTSLYEEADIPIYAVKALFRMGNEDGSENQRYQNEIVFQLFDDMGDGITRPKIDLLKNKWKTL